MAIFVVIGAIIVVAGLLFAAGFFICLGVIAGVKLGERMCAQ